MLKLSKVENYTLFYCTEDGKMHSGTCREDKEVLVDVSVGDVAEIEGYRGEGLTLILSGLDFETTADIALVVPGGTTIVLESGENRLAVQARGEDANAAVLYSQGDMTITGGEGKLLCDATKTVADNCTWSRGICARYGNLTISGGNVDVKCGECSRKAGAYYAGGRLYGGEQQKGAIAITGGTLMGTSVHDVIRATEDLLTLGAGAKVENSDQISSCAEDWHGSFVAQADKSKPVVITF